MAHANARLRDIVERFEARAAELEPHLDSPGVAEDLLAEAQRALSEAIAVVDELRAELDGQAASLAGPTPAAPRADRARRVRADARTGIGLAAAPPMGPLRPRAGCRLGLGDARRVLPPRRPYRARRRHVRGRRSGSVTRRQPALAPNTVAADAVRHALTQLGVPYQWGGTAPGVGLDCSGLTQWAYHEAGLNIARLAQEQDIGAAVDAGSLRPGDLAVWDGHVAMIVGNGTMIEAGDPVQLSPIRTTNAGQGFQGFWRPTG